jgi:hypothetical protein
LLDLHSSLLFLELLLSSSIILVVEALDAWITVNELLILFYFYKKLVFILEACSPARSAKGEDAVRDVCIGNRQQRSLAHVVRRRRGWSSVSPSMSAQGNLCFVISIFEASVLGRGSFLAPGLLLWTRPPVAYFLLPLP